MKSRDKIRSDQDISGHTLSKLLFHPYYVPLPMTMTGSGEGETKRRMEVWGRIRWVVVDEITRLNLGIRGEGKQLVACF